MIGRQFDKLTVTRFAGLAKTGHRYFKMWECLCECGNVRLVRQRNLLDGKTKSCGCKTKENK